MPSLLYTIGHEMGHLRDYYEYSTYEVASRFLHSAAQILRQAYLTLNLSPTSQNDCRLIRDLYLFFVGGNIEVTADILGTIGYSILKDVRTIVWNSGRRAGSYITDVNAHLNIYRNDMRNANPSIQPHDLEGQTLVHYHPSNNVRYRTQLRLAARLRALDRYFRANARRLEDDSIQPE